MSATELVNELHQHKQIFDTEWFKNDPDLKILVIDYGKEYEAQQSKRRLFYSYKGNTHKDKLNLKELLKRADTNSLKMFMYLDKAYLFNFSF